MLRRWLQGLFVCVLAVVMLGAGDSASRFNKIGHEMICQCGCGQVLLECNHVNCPVSPVMINELHAQLNAGGSDTMILNWFEAKYGAIVLAAPIRGGFDNVAWIVPAAVFGFGDCGDGDFDLGLEAANGTVGAGGVFRCSGGCDAGADSQGD